jgi:hypothetical protein
MFMYESTGVAIICGELQNGRTLVTLNGLVSQNVPISPALKEFVAEQTGEYTFGHPVYQEINGKAFIHFRHTLLGDFLDPDELMVALSAVAQSSNDLDDVIRDRFGGERWTDPPPDA